MLEKVSFLFSEFNIGGMETSMIRIARSMILSKRYDVIFITTEKESIHIPPDIEYLHIKGFNEFFPYFHFIKVKNTINKLNISTHLIVFERIFQSILPYTNGTKICMLRNNHSEIYRRAFVNYHYVHGFIGNSPSNKYYVDSHEIKHNKYFEYIPNGISLDNLRIIEKETPKGSLNILFVGRIVDESKGVFGLHQSCLQLINKKIDFILTIVGEGQDLIELKNLFKDNIFTNRIIYKPFLSKEDLVIEYQKANILLMPSNYEGLPNVLIEAQLHGCVPIATDLKNSTDLVINDNVNGFLFEKGDYDKMTDIIVSLYRNKNMINRISVAASRNIFENFSSEIEFTRYEKAIKKIKHIKINKTLFREFSLELFRPSILFIRALKIIQKKLW